MTKRSSNVALSALVFLVFLASIVGLWIVEARSLPRLQDVVVETPQGERFPISIPFRDPSRQQAAEYRIGANLHVGTPVRAIFRIAADDCLTGLEVNDKPFPLERTSASRCDWRAGFDIDLREYVHPGDNTISMSVRNVGGPWGLDVRPSVRDPVAQWIGASFLVILVAFVIAALKRLGILRADRRGFWVAAGLISVGAALRFAFVFSLHLPEDHVYSDMASYVDAANAIAAGKRGPEFSFHPVGYPLMLALSLEWTGRLSLAVGAQYLMSVATFVLMWRGSVRFLRERRALLVLLIGALHFPFISLSGFFMAETGFAFFLALLFYELAARLFPWSPVDGLALGAAYMAAAWMKGNNSLFGPILFGWIALGAWRRRARSTPAQWKAIGKAAATFAAGACLMAMLIAISTYSLSGHPRIAAATGALNLVEGKCPDKVNVDLTGYTWKSPLFAQLGELGVKHWPAYFWDAPYFWKAGLSCIQKEPWVLVTSVRYVYYLFFDNQLWPSMDTQYAGINRFYGMLCSAFLFPGMLVGLLLASRRPFSGRRPAFLPIASLCLASWLLKSEVRYRVPFDVVIIPVSVLGWTWLLRAVYRRRAREVGAPFG